MIPGPTPAAAGPPTAKELAGPRRETPKADDGRSRFAERAESILAALADGARALPEQQPQPPPEGTGADPPPDTAGPGRRDANPRETARSVGDVERNATTGRLEGPAADPVGDLARSRQSYGNAQARLRAAVHPPGSLLDLEV